MLDSFVKDMPRHIAIIMDGNGRWAEQRGKPRSAGHQSGVVATRNIVEHCARLRVDALTLYAFSSENWQRPETEVSFLMELFVKAIRSELNKLHENNIRVQFIGELSKFSDSLLKEINVAQDKTAGNTGMHLNIAVNYGGRGELVNAMTDIARKVQAGSLHPAEITEQTVSEHTWLAACPEPDLFVRTGGEQRLSNYLLWHLAYTELAFTDTLWPDFDGAELNEIINHYASRQRRFGQTGDQVQASQ